MTFCKQNFFLCCVDNMEATESKRKREDPLQNPTKGGGGSGSVEPIAKKVKANSNTKKGGTSTATGGDRIEYTVMNPETGKPLKLDSRVFHFMVEDARNIAFEVTVLWSLL